MPVMGRGGAVARVLLATAVVLAGASCHRSAAARTPGSATVVEVVDGDTVRVRLRGDDESVRLLGIDTPEVKDPRKPVQCFGVEASNHTKTLLPKGTSVRLVRDVEARDRYGRLLAYLYRSSDGTFVNLELAEQGYAVPLTYPPNVTHADAFVAAAGRAREAGRGLWGRCGGPGVPAK